MLALALGPGVERRLRVLGRPITLARPVVVGAWPIKGMRSTECLLRQRVGLDPLPTAPLDGAIGIFCGVGGVQAQSESVMSGSAAAPAARMG